MSYLKKSKEVFTNQDWLKISGVCPDKLDRAYEDLRIPFMRLMVEWNERAAMMTCSDCSVEEAEIAAWHDLKLDEVFFGKRMLH